MTGSSFKRTNLVLVALVAALVVVFVVVTTNPTARSHLETANNIIRSYRCPPGGYPAGRRANGNCLCLRCNYGHRCPGGHSGQVPCGPGQYQDVTGQDKCKATPPGNYNPGNGARHPVPCNYGSYNPHSGKRSCKAASPGHKVPSKGSTKQYPCPVRRYQNLGGQRSCKASPPGHYVNKPGQSRATQCNYGKYQDQAGQLSCKNARPGKYVNAKGQTSDRPCGRNQFQHCNGQINCIPCPRGLVSDAGATRCVVRLPPITFTDRAGDVRGSDKYRFLALGAPRKFKSVTFSWQGKYVTVQFPGRYTPFGNNVGITSSTNVKVLASRGVPGEYAPGRTVKWCKMCASNRDPKYGDTCWGLVLDNHRSCGCNSAGWVGRGMYYGGFRPHKCNRCGCWGGGFSGYRGNGQQKGKVNVGVSIRINR